MVSLNTLNNYQVRTRISLLGGLGITAILVLAMAYWVGDRRSNASFELAQAYNKLAANAEHVEIAALQIRRREKDFLLRRDMKYAERYKKNHAMLMKRLEQIRGMSVAKPIATNLDALVQGARAHADQFAKVVAMQQKLGLNEKQGLQGALRDAVHNAESKLKEAKLDALTVKMLMMRRHEKDFIMRVAKKYIDKFVKRRAEFDKLLAEAPVSPAYRKTVTGFMDTYLKDFKTFAETTLAFKSEVKKLSAIYADMAPHFDALAKAANRGKSNSETEMAGARRGVQVAIAIAAAVTLALAVLLSVMIGRSISIPIGEMTEAMGELADGRLDVDIPATENRDEIGAMARAMLVFRQNAEERARLEAREEEERAAKERRMVALDQMINGFESQVQAVVKSVASAATELQATAEQMTSTAEESSTLSTSIASASNQATANVQTVAAAAEELATSIDEISRQVNQSSTVARSALAEAESSAARFQALAGAADKIGEIVGLIQGVAEQTNLLALNATIEAARAGETGKGFAVVASEVKNLANQTAKATEEIASQVAGVQEESKQAVSAIERIKGVIDEMNNISVTIASAMEEQSSSTQEISRNVQEAARGTQEVSNNIDGLSTAANQTGAASSQVLTSSSDLSRQFEQLRGEVDKFLAEVRAA